MVATQMTWSDAVARLDLDLNREARTGAEPSAIRRPAALEFIGKAIAARLRTDVDLVLTWESVDDAILGHIVARELGIDNTMILEPQEGQLCTDRPPLAGQRVALVGVAFKRMNAVRAPIGMVASCGATINRVVTLARSAVVESEVDDPATLVVMSAG